MPYVRLGLAALVVGAIRAAVADPAEQEQLDEQGRAIAEVRSRFDTLNSHVETLSAAVASGQALDADQAETLAGIKAELSDLATALTGPADDPNDNGVIAEVEPAAIADPSPAADAIVEEAPAASGGGEETKVD